MRGEGGFLAAWLWSRRLTEQPRPVQREDGECTEKQDKKTAGREPCFFLTMFACWRERSMLHYSCA